MLSTKFRKITMGENQVSLGYSFFLWGVITWQKILDISADYLTNNRGGYIVIESN